MHTSSDWLRWAPPRAALFAGEVDTIFLALCALTLFFVVVISGFIVVFGIRYRRSVRPDPPPEIGPSIPLEIAWIAIPFAIAVGAFAWGARVYLRRFSVPPAGAYQVAVLGKQWMWHFEHPDGRREINEVHLPLGQPVRFLMVSEDVIHSLFIPAFRIKHDVLPMRYTSLWAQPTSIGTFHLFCAEYCGTDHSRMLGKVHVLAPADFARWKQQTVGMGSAAAAGKVLLEVLGCRACHRLDSLANAPSLEGLFNGFVSLEGGAIVRADENYIRRSIVAPEVEIVGNYRNAMPSYRGRVSEAQLLQILAYLKSVASEGVRE